ncbi:sugar O-acetyltransferase [Solwaraspora sp. WMMD792]|uniref:sugar O-acetyltransferase n=1 Tax=Solwaraspora sp. WMMD792 TaxID=3016099 RepID=UPI003242B45A
MGSGGDGRSMRERMVAGALYRADDPELVEMSLRAVDLTEAYNRTSARDGGRRRALLVELFAEVGDGAEVRPPLRVDYGAHISVGSRTFVNFGLVALDAAAITVGDDVQIGCNVQLLTPSHPLAAGSRRDKWESAEPVRIGDNVWLGSGVIVLPGVEIGRDTVVGAGSVVTRSLPAGVLATGNPARVVRDLPGDRTGGG